MGYYNKQKNRYGGKYQAQQSSPPNKVKNELSSYKAVKDIPADKIVDWGMWLADKISSVKTHQLRRIFSEIKQLENEIKIRKDYPPQRIKERLMFLKPLLAYTQSRTNAIEPLVDVLSEAIDIIYKEPTENVRESFLMLVKLMEAVIAYHKERD